MKLPAALCALLFAGCATAPSLKPASISGLPAGSSGPTAGAQDMAEPVRVETRAGTFLVSPEHAEDFSKVLAGEPTSRPFFAGSALDASTY